MNPPRKGKDLQATEKETAPETELPAPLEDILELVPVESRPQAEILIEHYAALYSGPVPHSSEMERYGRINETFPERFVAMAEKQSEHRRAMEKGIIEGDLRLKRRGQDYALIAIVIILGFALALAMIGATTAAGIVGGTTVVGVVTAFVVGRALDKKSDGN